MDEVIHLAIFPPEILGSSDLPSLNPMPILPWTLWLGLRGKWKKYLCIVMQCDHYYYEHPFMIIREASLMIWLMYKREKIEIIGGAQKFWLKLPQILYCQALCHMSVNWRIIWDHWNVMKFISSYLCWGTSISLPKLSHPFI